MNIEIHDLVKIYPGGRQLFSGLTTDFKDDEFVCLVGPSGCGKSTLLRLIARLDTFNQGRIRSNPLSPLGFVFQEPRLLPWRTVRENLMLPSEIKGTEISEVDLKKTMSLVRLPSSTLDRFPHELSGGMKMRISLSRALLINPEILLMDEPLAALDESTRQILQEEIAHVFENKKMLTIFVTHFLSEAVFLADRIVIMGSRGEIQHDFRVDLPRPRDEQTRTHPRFIELLQNLQHEFRLMLAEERPIL